MQSFTLPYALATLLVVGSVVTVGWIGVSRDKPASVSIEPDAFVYKGFVTNRTAVETYLWDNSKNRAVIASSGTFVEGTMTILIRDSTDREVFTQGYGVASEFSSQGTKDTGVPGRWTVSIVFSEFTGVLDVTIFAT